LEPKERKKKSKMSVKNNRKEKERELVQIPKGAGVIIMHKKRIKNLLETKRYFALN